MANHRTRVLSALRAGSALSALACGVFTLTAQASAQDAGSATTAQTAENANTAQDDETDRTIIVTGTNIRGVAPVGAKPSVVTRQAIEESGMSQAADILRLLPQTQNNSAFSDQVLQANPNGIQAGGFVTSNETRGSAIDLRGLGPNATLILVDGRRQLATGTTESFVEANRVPPSALERIEVVTDGASAIYGSDAVAGVVNYITRKDFEGLEAAGRYTFNDAQTQWGLAVTGGAKWDVDGRAGNIIVSYDFNKRNLVTGADNPRFGADQTRYGGNNSVYVAGTTPTPAGAGFYYANVCPNSDDAFFLGTCYRRPDFKSLGPPSVKYFDIPGGTTGKPAASPALAFPTNIQSSDPFRTFQAAQKTHSLNVFFNQDLTSSLTAYAQFNGTLRLTDQIGYTFTDVTVTNQSPFFPLFSGTAPTSVTVPLHGFPMRTRQTESYNDSITLGLRAEIGGDWQGEFYATRATARFSPGNDSAGSRSPNQAALSRLALRGEFNPFVSAPLSQDVLDAATYQGSEDYGGRSNAKSWDYVLKFNGPAFTIPGGDVKVAAGVEHSTFENNYVLSDALATCSAETTSAAQRCTLAYRADPIRSGSTDRKVIAIFGEVNVPLVGPDNEMSFVRRLNLSLAARWEHYSDFGNTFNPRFGLNWGVHDDFTFHASWGKSFRAPNLTEISASSLPYVFLSPDNRTGTPVDSMQLTLNGANPDLRPETATNWSLGFDYNPGFLEGLKIGTSFYKVSYKNKINVQPVTRFLQPDSAATYAPYVTEVPGPYPYPGCVASDPSTYHPLVAAVMTTPPNFEQVVGNICKVQTILDGRWQNAASVVQTGLDFNAAYAWEMGPNNFSLDVNFTKIFSLKERLTALGPMTTPDPINRIYMPLDFRARGNIRWSRGPFSANVAVNYTPGYLNDVGFIQIFQPPTPNAAPLPPSRVPSWVTADLSLGYRFENEGVLSGTRLGLNIQNVTDADAPIVLSGQSLNTSYDGRVHNPFGRTFNFQVTKTF
jgi:iron complex outermembrane recepter protein